MPTPRAQRLRLPAAAVAGVALLLVPAGEASTSEDRVIEDIIRDSVDEIVPAPSPVPVPPLPSSPPPTPAPTSPPPSTAPASPQTTAPATAPATSAPTSVNRPAGEPLETTGQPRSGSDQAGAGLAPLAWFVGVAGAALVIRRRRRTINRPRVTPDPRTRSAATCGFDTTASIATDGEIDVVDRHVGTDREWMNQQLRQLAHRLGPSNWQRMPVDLVQLGSDRTLEVAFSHVIDIAAPGAWTRAADRVWRLESFHDEDTVPVAADEPAVECCLIPVGEDANGARLFWNSLIAAAVNVTGDMRDTARWIVDVLADLAGPALGAPPMMCLVGELGDGAPDLPDGVARLEEQSALELIDARPLGGGTDRRRSGSCRVQTGRSIIVVLAQDLVDARWAEIAVLPEVTVLSTNHYFVDGVAVRIRDGSVSIPSLEVETTISPSWGIASEDDGPPSDSWTTGDAILEPLPLDVAVLDMAFERDDDWEAPLWPVMINVLGTPTAYRHGKRLKLTPQQLSALALIATKREVAAHDFRRSIWGDEDDVSAERVRDMLSQLRKKVGGLGAIPKREDGLVCAGDELGSDTLRFDALVQRAAIDPDCCDQLLDEAFDLVTGRVLDVSSSDAVWWRWSEIAFGSPDWTAKVTHVATTLARTRIEHGDFSVARDITERGLIADPLHAQLTELLMESYAGLGAGECAQRLFESHDRSLDLADLGRASAQTRRVLERIRTATTSDDPVTPA